jgi:uncharacterized protein
MKNSSMLEQQPRRKHVPLRTCVICREKSGKRTFTRIVRTEHGVMVDPTGKMDGRGAYLCNQASCWERAIKSDVLNQALRTLLTDEDRHRLHEAQPSV